MFKLPKSSISALTVSVAKPDEAQTLRDKFRANNVIHADRTLPDGRHEISNGRQTWVQNPDATDGYELVSGGLPRGARVLAAFRAR